MCTTPMHTPSLPQQGGVAPPLIPGVCRGFLPALGIGGSLQAEVKEDTSQGSLSGQCPRSPARWTKVITGRKVAGRAHQRQDPGLAL